MPTSIQTVAGAGQFTGAAGLGLITFGATSLRDTERAVIKSVSYMTTVAHDALLVLRSTTFSATEQQVLLEAAVGLTNVTLSNFLIDCGQNGEVVPREPAAASSPPGLSFILRFSTTNKTATGTFIADWEIENMTEGG
jgi:hypothetical protein